MKEEKKRITITTKDGKPMVIPPEGSLGLLALGYIGLIAWRQTRNAYIAQMKAQEAEQAGQKTEEGNTENG